MSDHTTLRLEHPSTTVGGNSVVAYFAPNFTIEPILKNELFAEPRAGGDATIARDEQLITHQLTVQGVFDHSDNLRSGHVSDLETMLGTSAPITAREQVNRVKHYLLEVGGPFNFYDGTDAYEKTSDANVDPKNGDYPTVQIDEFRPPSEGGFERYEYLCKMEVGLEDP